MLILVGIFNCSGASSLKQIKISRSSKTFSAFTRHEDYINLNLTFDFLRLTAISLAGLIRLRI